MTALVVRADARALPLPDESVDLVVTSPPYFALRDYRDGDASLAGQIGAEPTPGEYMAALLDCTREWVRVLKPSGSIFVVLGDKYSQRPGQYEGSRRGHCGQLATRRAANAGTKFTRDAAPDFGVPAKSLLCLPERYRIGCIDQLRLIARAVGIWCLSGGARVYARTKSGDRPLMLRDLVRAYRPQDVQVWNGAKWTQVLGWNRSPEREGALEIELRTGERIGCTTGHRWPTHRGVIRSDDLRVGDVIRTTRLPESEEVRQPSALDDEDIGWLVGLYIAEGSRSEKTLQFAGHRREETRHARLSRIAAAYHGNSAVYQTSENGVTCNLNGAVLLGIVDHYVGRGRTAKNKRLRKAVWQRSDRFLAALMDGYLSGDGHFDAKNNRWRLGFGANDEWAADLRTLAARLGTRLSLRRHNHMFQNRTYPGWRGEWRWERSTHHNAKHDGEIVAIRKSRAREFYDLGVADEPHLFALASGVLTHNSKPNGLPESVTDRWRRSHEDIVHLTKRERYYSAVDEIREPGTGRGSLTWEQRRNLGEPGRQGEQRRTFPDGMAPNLLGKLPGSVWEIASQPFIPPAEIAHARCCRGRGTNCDRGLSHYAAYPPALVRRIVLGWSPPGICTKCGEARQPIFDHTKVGGWTRRTTSSRLREGSRSGGNEIPGRRVHHHTEATRVGEICACPTPDAPTRPAIVIDPFGGTGTTALTASVHGRIGLSFDLSHDYGRLAQWRTTDPAERAQALGVPKPPPVPDGQGNLFEGIA